MLNELTLEQLEALANSNMMRGIRVSPELRAEIAKRKRDSITRDDAQQQISMRIMSLVNDGMSAVDAMRIVCGVDVVDAMIDKLYNELRAGKR
jgi:hypothetical protein